MNLHNNDDDGHVTATYISAIVIAGSPVGVQINVQLYINKPFQSDYNDLSNPNTAILTNQLCGSVSA